MTFQIYKSVHKRTAHKTSKENFSKFNSPMLEYLLCVKHHSSIEDTNKMNPCLNDFYSSVSGGVEEEHTGSKQNKSVIYFEGDNH